jgi:pimeloyl-ACP methyl ester carboxylesterase
VQPSLKRRLSIGGAAILSCALLVAVLLRMPLIRNYENAALLLLRLEHLHGPGWLNHVDSYPVTVTELDIPSPGGAIHAKLYSPDDASHAPPLVLLHGVHRLGMNDPRLVLLASAFAERGILVLTPELKALEDYRIAPAEIDVIGRSAQYLDRQTDEPVGVLGVSFSGSLALLAAADPRYSSSMSCLVAVGAYDDLGRVAHFLITGEAILPDGSVRRQAAEQYGALVLIYAHPEQYFSAHDAPLAQHALKLWLEEQFETARSSERELSAAGRAEVEALFQHHMALLQNQIDQGIAADAAEMSAVSPHGKLASLRLPVFLLHGEGDEVIPSSETQWLARDIPPGYLRALLITPAFGHVDASRKIALKHQWELISFMASIFRQLGSIRPYVHTHT